MVWTAIQHFSKMLSRLAYANGTYIDTYLSLLRSSIHYTINDNESSRSKRNQRVIKLNRYRWMSVQTTDTLDLLYQQQKQCYDILLWQILTFLSSSVLNQRLDEILSSLLLFPYSDNSPIPEGACYYSLIYSYTKLKCQAIKIKV